MKVSVVILNWNGASLLKEFLPSVIEHTKLPEVEIVVADNGSTDNSIEILKENFPTVRIIQNQNNEGFAGGYNLALRNLKSEYFLLLNSDVEVTEGWIQPLINHLDHNRNCAVCGSKLLDIKNRNRFEYAVSSGGYSDIYGFPFCRGRIFTTLEEDQGQYNDVCDVLWVSGACLMIRSDVFYKIGGFDSAYFAHLEEIDLCWRVKNCGYEVNIIPESKVYHLGGASLNAQNPHKTYLNFRNSLLTLYKNLPTKMRNKVLLFRILLDTIAFLKFLITDGHEHAIAIIKAHRDFRIMIRKYPANSAPISLPSGFLKTSLVMTYYLSGKKLFSQLKHKIT